MTRETKAFLCDFKCRTRPMLRRRNMEAHEAKCFLNPARKTCATCAHNYREDQDEETGYPGGWRCAIEKKPATISDDYGENRQVTLMFDCPFWEVKAVPA